MATALHQIRKPKTQRGKRILKAREPKIFENDKQTFFALGENSGAEVGEIVKKLYLLKRENGILLKRWSKPLRPFENETSLESMSRRNDASLFVVGTKNKKRPRCLTIGRMFDYKVLDMIELNVDSFNSSLTKGGFAFGTSPAIMFVGEQFETDATWRKVKSVLIDLFGKPSKSLKQIALTGIEHVITFALVPTMEKTDKATDDGMRILMKNYAVTMKGNYDATSIESNGTIPTPELTDVGPTFKARLTRTKFASETLFKQALRQPVAATVHKTKNVEYDPFGTRQGRIHMQRQDFDQLHTRRVKGLRPEMEAYHESRAKPEDEEDEDGGDGQVGGKRARKDDGNTADQDDAGSYYSDMESDDYEMKD